ncbi:T-cell surface glycoprotein CD8 alpha chain isoform X2 [Clupea harengus]|uniref:T-cell surface glycoprotein CD8 alpha chain isoform X2 n=1 Tax=Clupea harengus TaxID=7950 RepID=A0A6P8GDI4_CLUHA|nr:T-cell surface glycoprotein CD8 alpha chain isoform X2 [Clupea harengus]
MQLKWTEIFILLCILHACTSQTIVPEGGNISIECQVTKDISLTVMWFRVTEKTGVQFLASIRKNVQASKPALPGNIEIKNTYTLKLKSFKKNHDSGNYSCANYNSHALQFGQASFVQGTPDIKPTPPKKVETTCSPVESTPAMKTIAKACVCPKRVKADPETRCEMLIWAPLVGGCGLLLVLLIAVSLICNKIRTKRCPHHYKRQPRTDGGMLHPGRSHLI